MLTADFSTGITARLSESAASDAHNPKNILTFELESAYNNDDTNNSIIMPDCVQLNTFDDKLELSRIQKPGESALLVSSKLLSHLQSFPIPAHNVFPAELTHNKEVISQTYKYLVFPGQLLDHTKVEDTIYKIVNRSAKKDTIAIIENIQSQESLNALKKEYRNQGKMVLVDVFRLSQNYDLWWGGSSFVYISELLQQSLEHLNFTGVATTFFDKFSIAVINQAT